MNKPQLEQKLKDLEDIIEGLEKSNNLLIDELNNQIPMGSVESKEIIKLKGALELAIKDKRDSDYRLGLLIETLHNQSR